MKIMIELSMKHLVLDATPEILAMLENAQVVSCCYEKNQYLCAVEQDLKVDMKLISDAEFNAMPLIEKEIKNDV